VDLKDAMGIVLDGARAVTASSTGVAKEVSGLVYGLGRVAYRLLEQGLNKDEILERIETIAPHKAKDIDRKIDAELDKLSGE
jgi:hypothetical protein